MIATFNELVPGIFWILLMYFYQLPILVVNFLVESHGFFLFIYFLHIIYAPSRTT